MKQILVDTSVWIDFLRSGDDLLADLLTQNRVCIHPMIIGELACGHLRQRKSLLALWNNLPQATQASHEEVMYFLENQQLMGQGIGYVDLHLLAAAALSHNTRLWSRDKRLNRIAQELALSLD